MSKNITDFDLPIHALACETDEGEFHIYECEEPIKMKDIDFHDEFVRVGDFYIILRMFASVIVCTEEVLEQLREEIAKELVIA